MTIKSSGTIETTGEKPRLTVKNFAMYFSNCETLKTNLSAAFSERKEGRKEARMMLARRLRGEGIHNAVWPVSYLLVQHPATAHISNGRNPTAPSSSLQGYTGIRD